MTIPSFSQLPSRSATRETALPHSAPAKRKFGAKVPGESEAAIQRSIIAYLEAVVPRCEFFAVPNSAVRKRGGRAGNAVAGLKRGVSDICLIPPGGRAHFIEVKSAKGKLSEEQQGFQLRIQSLGGGAAICRSIDDVRIALAAWKIQTKERVA